ncbi:MAG: IPTL-CTERM sorting domain-containing protein [Planctomycetes bacterium]|nr:IPTL-CTERM sorting domain-containing protein [Planctomycetota bacterium]
MRPSILIGTVVALAATAPAQAGTPGELLHGEAPLLFTSSEGANLNNPTTLRDGQLALGDDIWLWLPAIAPDGQVDLAATGMFFKIWDSGPVNGPNGNDDDDNGMRGMDFDPASGTFLISYEDSTTTGFTDLPAIKDGAVVRMTPTSLIDGFIDAFSLELVYDECLNKEPGCIGTGDINALSLPGDGTLYYGAGGAQTIQTDGGGTVSVGTSTLVHADISGDPVNIGPDVFFEAALTGCGIPFCPGIYTGQLRGADVLVDSLVTFGTSGNYMNQTPDGNNVELVCAKADICSVPNLESGATTLEQRTAEVLYAGNLFFETPNVANAELLDHDILDSTAEVVALIALLGEDSTAGLALAPFAEAGKQEPIPTIGEWGMIVMTVLIIGAAGVVMRTRRGDAKATLG